MAERIDARGLSCPQPVLVTKNKINEIGKGTIEVMVDTATARENISRMAEHQGWQVKVRESDDEYILTISK